MKNEDDSTSQEKVLFLGIILLFGSITYGAMNYMDSVDKYEPKCTGEEQPYIGQDTKWKLPDTIRVTTTRQQRIIRWSIRDQRQFEMEKAIEDYIEDNPDLINQYLDR